jgi:hypothetical protein
MSFQPCMYIIRTRAKNQVPTDVYYRQCDQIGGMSDHLLYLPIQFIEKNKLAKFLGYFFRL